LLIENYEKSYSRDPSFKTVIEANNNIFISYYEKLEYYILGYRIIPKEVDYLVIFSIFYLNEK